MPQAPRDTSAEAKLDGVLSAMGSVRMGHHASPRTEKYGPLPDQEGDLYLPTRPHAPVICLLHGGFWRMPHGRDQMTAIAQDLVSRGFAVWNLEYRRLGVAGSGWPGTFDDVIAGIERLARFVSDGMDLDLERVVVSGHSAGGHLALWASARQHRETGNGAARSVRIRAVAGQAPVADLVRAYELAVGGSAVRELLGGSPEQCPGRYQAASPQALLPLEVPQLIIHGAADDVVPIEMARRYTETSRAAGDEVELLELPDTGHMEFLDPASAAHAALCSWLLRIP